MLNESLRTPFIDTTKILATITNKEQSWTATDDGYVRCTIVSHSGTGAVVYLDDVNMFSEKMGETTGNGGFYIKKDQTLSTGRLGTYTITVYGLL